MQGAFLDTDDSEQNKKIFCLPFLSTVKQAHMRHK